MNSSGQKIEHKWSDFRRNMPYGCVYNPYTKTLQWFNRDYTYVEASHGVWRDTPEGLEEFAFFYGDGSKPLHSKEMMEKYRAKLEKFKGWTVAENDKGYPAQSTDFYIAKSRQYKTTPLW